MSDQRPTPERRLPSPLVHIFGLVAMIFTATAPALRIAVGIGTPLDWTLIAVAGAVAMLNVVLLIRILHSSRRADR